MKVLYHIPSHHHWYFWVIVLLVAILLHGVFLFFIPSLISFDSPLKTRLLLVELIDFPSSLIPPSPPESLTPQTDTQPDTSPLLPPDEKLTPPNLQENLNPELSPPASETDVLSLTENLAPKEQLIEKVERSPIEPHLIEPEIPEIDEQPPTEIHSFELEIQEDEPDPSEIKPIEELIPVQQIVVSEPKEPEQLSPNLPELVDQIVQTEEVIEKENISPDVVQEADGSLGIPDDTEPHPLNRRPIKIAQETERPPPEPVQQIVQLKKESKMLSQPAMLKPSGKDGSMYIPAPKGKKILPKSNVLTGDQFLRKQPKKQKSSGLRSAGLRSASKQESTSIYSSSFFSPLPLGPPAGQKGGLHSQARIPIGPSHSSSMFYGLSDYNWSYESYMERWARGLLYTWSIYPPRDYIRGNVPDGGNVYVTVTLNQEGKVTTYGVTKVEFASEPMVDSVLNAIVGTTNLPPLPPNFKEKELVVNFKFIYPAIDRLPRRQR